MSTSAVSYTHLDVYKRQPTDNLFAENMPTAALVAENAKIPVICGESGMVAVSYTHLDVYKRQVQEGNV